MGFLGRFAGCKRVDRLLDALALCRSERVTLSIVGDGPLRPQYQERAMRLGVGDRLRLRGPVRDAAEAMRDFDLLVMPSEGE